MVNGWDGAARVLAVMVRLLPPARRGWGTAMRAELAGVAGPAQRWWFTMGCARAIVTRPAVWRRVGPPVLVIGVLAVTLRFTARVGYAPLRWELVGLVGVLAVVAGLGRVRPFGPVDEGPAARCVRTIGYVLVGTLAAEAVTFLAGRDNHDLGGGPVLTVMFAGCLLGVLALTSRRSPATGRVMVTGLLAGGAAAALWTAAVLVFPPIPADPGLAIVTTVTGASAAIAIVNRRDGADAGLLAGLCAASTGALVILHAVLVLSVLGPARLIPDLVPAARTPAADLANSRIELQDPYMWLLLLAWLAAIVQGIAALAGPHPAAAAADSSPSGTGTTRTATATATVASHPHGHHRYR